MVWKYFIGRRQYNATQSKLQWSCNTNHKRPVTKHLLPHTSVLTLESVYMTKQHQRKHMSPKCCFKNDVVREVKLKTKLNPTANTQNPIQTMFSMQRALHLGQCHCNGWKELEGKLQVLQLLTGPCRDKMLKCLYLGTMHCCHRVTATWKSTETWIWYQVPGTATGTWLENAQHSTSTHPPSITGLR